MDPYWCKERDFLSIYERKKNVCCAFFFLLLKIKLPIALATIQPCNFDHRLEPYKGNQRQKKNTKIYDKCRNVYGFFLLPVSYIVRLLARFVHSVSIFLIILYLLLGA